MMIRKGMRIDEVLEVRTDVVKVSEEEWNGELLESYEGIADDGEVLCIDVVDGVVDEVVKAMYV